MRYDLIIVGGGLAGATLGKAMAEAGAQVLILEREVRFRDRVRGEGLLPWGVAEAKALGIYRLLQARCGHVTRWFRIYAPDGSHQDRDMVETTPYRAGALNFYHPAMQQTLLEAAEEAGATVKRGATVVGVAPGDPPIVSVQINREIEEWPARLVVGADGRDARSRGWAGLQVRRDPPCMIVAGVLCHNLNLWEEAVHFYGNPEYGRLCIIFPLGSRRFRWYLCYNEQSISSRLSGSKRIPDFIAGCTEMGVPAAWHESVEFLGPLAAYDGADRWVEHPCGYGISLVGDAAASPDPTFGTGLSLALRDVRVLRDCLLSEEDWNAAAHAYAEEHDRYYEALHRIEGWRRQLFYDLSPEGQELRQRVFTHERWDPPDFVGLGPDAPSDEAARRRFFAEE